MSRPFPFDPLHAEFVLVVKNFLFPVPHLIEEGLQAYGVDDATLVNIAI